MSGININGRKHSIILYADDFVKEEQWNYICKLVGKNPKDYNWLRINFDDEDIDDYDDLLTED